MSTITTSVEWHILKRNPEDLPDTDTGLIVTVEGVDGARQTILDARMRYDENDNPVFYQVLPNANRWGEIVMDDVDFWEPVIAWMYPPEPFIE